MFRVLWLVVHWPMTVVMFLREMFDMPVVLRVRMMRIVHNRVMRHSVMSHRVVRNWMMHSMVVASLLLGWCLGRSRLRRSSRLGSSRSFLDISSSGLCLLSCSFLFALIPREVLFPVIIMISVPVLIVVIDLRVC